MAYFERTIGLYDSLFLAHFEYGRTISDTGFHVESQISQHMRTCTVDERHIFERPVTVEPSLHAHWSGFAGLTWHFRWPTRHSRHRRQLGGAFELFGLSNDD